MACYRCGSERGSDVVLCPDCVTARLSESKDLRKMMGSSAATGSYWTQLRDSLMSPAGALGVLFLLSVAGFAALGPASLMPADPETIYQGCLSHAADLPAMQKQMLKQLDGLNSADSEELRSATQTVASALSRVSEQDFESFCTTVKEDCGSDGSPPRCALARKLLG